ncbi:hypothetical protein BCY84_19912 [Trypanosoma cruzi cruzi]|uniref:Uncharacterized protein n=1 Tax=Trypanosoma cruzi TaxID=5693 RepID=A0A2V2VDE1_TRYCR|nr:hypothetical protein TcBrA4_0055260 [Trypanosoma cruzi]PBJ69345.1 hypothetical protein BCY84_19912 [Trypanosoma cruzi cruzi]PWU92333.1 hypothetical protein C4B63_38g52 [Trypanosoma cruzi]
MATLSVARKDDIADPRQFGISTDDTAIYLEDSVDEPTARCISSAPSVVAILSPQRLPANGGHAVDITEYDSNSIGKGFSAKADRGLPLSDLTNSSTTRLSFSKSPTPRRSLSLVPHRYASSRTLGSSEQRQSHHHHGHHHHSYHGGTVSVERCVDAAHHEDRMVPLAEYERLQRERNRYEKMYEHQKALYEDMAQKQTETYQELQKKIIEVVALSTRNEENKRFIRQLKRDMADNRTRVIDIQNRALEETKQEKTAREQYQRQLHEYEEKYTLLIEKQETKLSSLGSLLKDVTCMRGECDRIQVSQLDSLLKAAYSKNTALFGDLLRQGRQIDLLFENKASLEKQLEQLRREKREIEAKWAEERRRMAAETERYSVQLTEQQRSILELRQMLIRTLGSETLAQGDERDVDDTNENDSSSYSSGCSSRDLEENEEEEESEGEDDDDSDNLRENLDATVALPPALPDTDAKKDSPRPPLPHVERPLERRATDLATLSAQIQAKLRSLPGGQV